MISTEKNGELIKHKEGTTNFSSHFHNHHNHHNQHMYQNSNLFDDLTLALKSGTPTEQAILLTLQKIYKEIKVINFFLFRHKI